jgi:magnesium chelatase subunit I
LEQISFEARESEYIDNKSGVSARLRANCFENLLILQRRVLKSGADKTTLRLSDFYKYSAITGKVEFFTKESRRSSCRVLY